MYFDKKNECMGRDELERLQLERLQSTLYRLSRNVPFYRKKFESLDLDVDELRSLDDVRHLPFTTKADLRDNYPYDMFAVPMREVVRLHASSGTTGKAVVVGYTKNDVRRWAKLAARVLVAGGVTEDDVVQIAFGYGLFTGGFGFHYGAELLGASVVAQLLGQHPPPGADHRGLQDNRPHLHPGLRHVPGRHHAQDGPQRERPDLEARAVRRGGMVRAHARGHPGRAQAHGHGQLRPVRDHGPGRGGRMPRTPGAAHQRRPFPGRDNRPRDPGARGARRGGASWC